MRQRFAEIRAIGGSRSTLLAMYNARTGYASRGKKTNKDRCFRTHCRNSSNGKFVERMNNAASENSRLYTHASGAPSERLLSLDSLPTHAPPVDINVSMYTPTRTLTRNTCAPPEAQDLSTNEPTNYYHIYDERSHSHTDLSALITQFGIASNAVP